MQTQQTIEIRSAPPLARAAEPLLEMDPRTFNERFNSRPFLMAHNLVGHPLFELDRLVKLATTLPEEDVEYNAGNIPVDQDPALTPRNGLSIGDTVRRIRDCGSWMALKRVDRDPEYSDLLERCLQEIALLSEPLAPGMCNKQGFIFISSPGSITPYHMDPEYNFLLHVQGTKTMYTFDGADPSVLSEQELEQYLSGGHRNLAFKDDYYNRMKPFDLVPGQGLHLPVTMPHWVKNGPEVSISFSVTFQTPASERRALVYTSNAQIRKMGLNPTPFDKVPLLDSSKYFGARVVRRLRRMVGSE